MHKNKLFSKENLIYTIIAIITILLLVVFRIMFGLSDYFYLFDMATIFCLLQTIFIAKHSVLGLHFGVIGSLIILSTDIIQSIWLNAAICAINTILSVIGIIRWQKNAKKDNSKNLRRLSLKQNIIIWSIYLAVATGLVFILKSLNSTLYYLDAYYSIGCLFITFLASQAYIDQFYFGYIVNIIGIVMYSILAFSNISNVSIILTCAIYFTLQIIGLINWLRLERKQNFKKESTSNS